MIQLQQINITIVYEKLEDIKEVTRSRKSKKDRQQNVLQNNTQKTKDRRTSRLSFYLK